MPHWREHMEAIKGRMHSLLLAPKFIINIHLIDVTWTNRSTLVTPSLQPCANNQELLKCYVIVFLDRGQFLLHVTWLRPHLSIARMHLFRILYCKGVAWKRCIFYWQWLIQQSSWQACQRAGVLEVSEGAWTTLGAPINNEMERVWVSWHSGMHAWLREHQLLAINLQAYICCIFLYGLPAW
jgi:hypothetical protein